MMPITMAKPGERVQVKRLAGKDEVRRHLNELGLVEGDYVTVIQNNNGNLIMQVKDGRIALDEKLAMRIQF
ncbi:MAG: ferrous iron transport protein A [Lachnospiraceae bacterium]|nr:ferrous iron transport protein A [Lachnospiraceae bacterium]